MLIIADDQGWADYSFQGHPCVRTPHIDRLAREGLVFPRGHVTSSLCCPSLASILTGLYPHQHGITSNDPPRPADMTAADFHRSPSYRAGRERMTARIEAVPTLPRQLASLGYRSLQTGKWWQGDYRRGGFTDGMTTGERHGDHGLVIGRQTLQPIYDFVADCRAKHQPLFVWYAPMMPHQPHDPPAALLERYRRLAPSEHVARYWAMIEWFDQTVGQLLDYLDREQLSQDTLVVYLADNGWIQHPERDRYAPRSKQSPYEGGLRTPLIVRWLGHIAPRRDEALASAIDVAPTILHACGLKSTAEMQGVDLMDAEAVAARPAIFGECFTHDAIDLERPAANLRWRWIIDGNWKLIVPHTANEPDAVVELFELAGDPDEQRNVAGTNPDRVLKLRRKLHAWWRPAKEERLGAQSYAPRAHPRGTMVSP